MHLGAELSGAYEARVLAYLDVCVRAHVAVVAGDAVYDEWLDCVDSGAKVQFEADLNPDRSLLERRERALFRCDPGHECGGRGGIHPKDNVFVPRAALPHDTTQVQADPVSGVKGTATDDLHRHQLDS